MKMYHKKQGFGATIFFRCSASVFKYFSLLLLSIRVLFSTLAPFHAPIKLIIKYINDMIMSIWSGKE